MKNRCAEKKACGLPSAVYKTTPLTRALKGLVVGRRFAKEAKRLIMTHTLPLDLRYVAGRLLGLYVPRLEIQRHLTPFTKIPVMWLPVLAVFKGMLMRRCDAIDDNGATNIPALSYYCPIPISFVYVRRQRHATGGDIDRIPRLVGSGWLHRQNANTWKQTCFLLPWFVMHTHSSISRTTGGATGSYTTVIRCNFPATYHREYHEFIRALFAAM